MKNRPLAFQIWLIIAGLMAVFCVLILAVLPETLQGFFTKQMYQTIQQSQQLYLSAGQELEAEDLQQWDRLQQESRSVQHLIVTERGFLILGSPAASIQQELPEIMAEARAQTGNQAEYVRELDTEKIYYIITRGDIWGQSAYLISYMWDSYQQELVKSLYRSLLMVFIIALLLSWIPAYFLARYLSRPLHQMEQDVRRIAERDWHEPLHYQRGDEIGRLGQSIESMRQQLLRQDEAQQTFLQNVSHELKTPVMVIRSYAQAIADGIFPADGLAGSVRVIDGEGERLEKRIRDLLCLSRINYLDLQNPIQEEVNLNELIDQVVNHLRWSRPELQWEQELEDICIWASLEQWRVILENLLDNQIRYAATIIRLHLYREAAGSIYLDISNDGPPIEAENLNQLFEPFYKGREGEFGLGLSIVRQVLIHQGGSIRAENSPDGPRFIIHWEGSGVAKTSKSF